MLEALTVDDLPGIMLSQRQLESLIGSIGPRSGFTSDVAVAERFPTLGLGVADIAAWDRQGGYLLAFDAWTLGRFNGGPATMEVGIELFQSSDGASAYLEARRQEMSLSDPRLGLTIESAEPFDVGRTDGTGLAVVATQAGYEHPVGATIASIQRGRLVSWVSIVEFDPFDRTLSAGRTAIVFDELIEDILSGVREPQEAPVIPASPVGFKGSRPKGAEDFAPLVMEPDAAPAGFHLVWDGYGAEPPHSYFRGFADQPFAKLTSLPLSSVQIQVLPLFDPRLFASVLHEQQSKPAETLAAELEAQTGLRDIELERMPLTHAEVGFATLVNGVDPLHGSFEYGVTWAARGDVALLVVVTGPTGLVTRSEILEISEAATERFATAIFE